MSLNIDHKRIWVAGHNGMVGSSLIRALKREKCYLLTVSRQDLDLRDQRDVHHWVKENQPDIILLAAAKVGGIGANSNYPAEFLYDNLMIETNIIHAAYQNSVEKLLFLGSSCIYPKYADQPIREESLLTSELEPTNEPYALAKIAGIKLCEAYRRQYGKNFISAMPCNLYGIGDSYDENNSHVIPAMIMKFHEAKIKNKKEVMLWGTGSPLREFLYVDDLADALLHLLKNYNGQQHINVGSGKEISIKDLALLVSDVVGFQGQIVFDETKPDGTPRKLLDNERINEMGWKPTVNLKDGLKLSYQDFLKKDMKELYAA